MEQASYLTQLLASPFEGSDANPSQAITNLCIGYICAEPMNGVADFTGLGSFPSGGAGITLPVLVSYSPVGANGVPSGTTSSIALTYVRVSGGSYNITLCGDSSCNQQFSPLSSPTMTLVGQ